MCTSPAATSGRPQRRAERAQAREPARDRRAAVSSSTAIQARPGKRAASQRGLAGSARGRRQAAGDRSKREAASLRSPCRRDRRASADSCPSRRARRPARDQLGRACRSPRGSWRAARSAGRPSRRNSVPTMSLSPRSRRRDVRAHDAGDRAFVGDRERRVAERARALDEFLRVRGAAQEAEIAEAVQLGVASWRTPGAQREHAVQEPAARLPARSRKTQTSARSAVCGRRSNRARRRRRPTSPTRCAPGRRGAAAGRRGAARRRSLRAAAARRAARTGAARHRVRTVPAPAPWLRWPATRAPADARRRRRTTVHRLPRRAARAGARRASASRPAGQRRRRRGASVSPASGTTSPASSASARTGCGQRERCEPLAHEQREVRGIARRRDEADRHVGGARFAMEQPAARAAARRRRARRESPRAARSRRLRREQQRLGLRHLRRQLEAGAELGRRDEERARIGRVPERAVEVVEELPGRSGARARPRGSAARSPMRVGADGRERVARGGVAGHDAAPAAPASALSSAAAIGDQVLARRRARASARRARSVRAATTRGEAHARAARAQARRR